MGRGRVVSHQCLTPASRYGYRKAKTEEGGWCGCVCVCVWGGGGGAFECVIVEAYKRQLKAV